MSDFPTKVCLGLNIVDIDYSSFISKNISDLDNSKSINIMSINLTALKRYDSEFQRFINEFDFTTADGKGLVIFSRFLGEKITNHLSVPRICDKFIEQFYLKKKKIFLLGATEEINRKSIENLKNKYQNIKVSGHHGYFDLENFDRIINIINDYKPELILVGISSPKKEKAILKLTKKYKNSINIACGGYIDILSGKIGKAPEFFHVTGMEWLYRFYEEPRRMFGPMIINGFFFLFYIFPISLVKKFILRQEPSILKIMNNYNKS